MILVQPLLFPFEPSHIFFPLGSIVLATDWYYERRVYAKHGLCGKIAYRCETIVGWSMARTFEWKRNTSARARSLAIDRERWIRKTMEHHNLSDTQRQQHKRPKSLWTIEPFFWVFFLVFRTRKHWNGTSHIKKHTSPANPLLVEFFWLRDHKQQQKN